MKYGYNSGGVWAVSEGRKPTKEYSRWATVMARCYNTSQAAYPRYGGSGVTVCSEWHDFQVFAQWYSENNVDGWVMDKDCAGGMVYSPETVIFIPDQVNQLLKCYRDWGIGTSGKYWFVKTRDADNKQHYKGKFETLESAKEYYQAYTRHKMRKLVDRYSIPAATAARLLFL